MKVNLHLVTQKSENTFITRRHNNSAKEHTTEHYYYSNKLILHHYSILFLTIIMQAMFSFILVRAILDIQQPHDMTIFILALVGSLYFPTAALILNVKAPNRYKRIQFDFKNTLTTGFIITACGLIVIYLFNIVILNMPLSFSSDFLFTLLLPTLVLSNTIISPLVCNKLLKSKKFR